MIGSYSSNAVYLLLARPIINVTTSVEDSLLRAVDPGTAGCPLDPDSEYTCFHFSACFRVEAVEDGAERNIRFNIVAEPNKPVSRVWLRLEDGDRTGNRTNTVEHNLVIQATDLIRTNVIRTDIIQINLIRSFSPLRVFR